MIGVTGATGKLGHLVVDRLLDIGVPAAEIVAAVRSPKKAADLAARGVQVRRADYDEPDTLAPAFAGLGKLLLISSNEVGRRIPRHQNVVNAARAAGVRFLAYTSIPKADVTPMLLAAEHKATEALIRESRIPFVFLRNSWYLENYTGPLAKTLERGTIVGSAGEGRISGATHADFAAAGAAVLATHGHPNRVYELGGDEAFTMLELAAEISRQSGTTVVYRDLPVDDYVEMLVGAGIPKPTARVLADADLGVARGDLFVDGSDLSRLIGRATTPMRRAVADALAARARSLA
jgi:NAD(P)H dehydrogenase (quinone)